MKKTNKNYQCVLCGHYWENAEKQPDQCPDCGCKITREVQRDNMDSVSPASTSHLRKKMETCPNYDIDMKTGAQISHKLELEREIDVSRANPKLPLERTSVFIRERCQHCKLLYTQASIPLSRPDVMQHMGILKEVESKLKGYDPAAALTPVGVSN